MKFLTSTPSSLPTESPPACSGPHPGWATRHQRLRFWIISKTNYIIYYESLEESVSIERVLDGRRDVHRIIELGYEDEPEETDQS